MLSIKHHDHLALLVQEQGGVPSSGFATLNDRGPQLKNRHFEARLGSSALDRVRIFNHRPFHITPRLRLGGYSFSGSAAGRLQLRQETLQVR